MSCSKSSGSGELRDGEREVLLPRVAGPRHGAVVDEEPLPSGADDDDPDERRGKGAVQEVPLVPEVRLGLLPHGDVGEGPGEAQRLAGVVPRHDLPPAADPPLGPVFLANPVLDVESLGAPRDHVLDGGRDGGPVVRRDQGRPSFLVDRLEGRISPDDLVPPGVDMARAGGEVGVPVAVEAPVQELRQALLALAKGLLGSREVVRRFPGLSGHAAFHHAWACRSNPPVAGRREGSRQPPAGRGERSRTSLTRARSASAVNGLGTKSIPSSRTPWRLIASWV